MKVLVILGSARKGGTGQRVGQWVKDAVNAQGDLELDYVSVDELNLPIFNEAFSPKYRHYTGDDYTNPDGKAWAERVAKAEAVIVVTPEYNHGYPGGLKNSFDWVGTEWQGKPVAFVGYSITQFGGVRAVEQLRQVVTEMGMHQVPNAVLVGTAQEVLSESGVSSSDELNGTLSGVLKDLVALGAK